jgi:hypothetical protein
MPDKILLADVSKSTVGDVSRFATYQDRRGRGRYGDFFTSEERAFRLFEIVYGPMLLT